MAGFIVDAKKNSLTGRFVIDVLSIALHVAPDYISQSTTTSSQEEIPTLDQFCSSHTPLPYPTYITLFLSSSQHVFILVRLAIARSGRFCTPITPPHTQQSPESFACSYPHLDGTSEHAYRVHQRRSMHPIVGVLQVRRRCGSFAL